MKSKSKIKKPTWCPNIKISKTIPFPFVKIPIYAKRIGIKEITLNQALRNGKIPTRFLIISKQLKSVKPAVYINYNESVVGYLKEKAPGWRPKDFKPSMKKYKPFSKKEWLEFDYNKKDVAPIDETVAAEVSEEDKKVQVGDTQMVMGTVTDLYSAKYRVEQLKIEEKENLIQLQRNESITIKDVLGVNREIAIEVKQALEKGIPDLTIKLAKTSDPKQISDIIRKHHLNSLKKLARLEKPNG